MPRILGQLWRRGARRAEVAEPAEAGVHQFAADPGEFEARLEDARRRLREAIPPSEERPPDDGPQK